MSAGCLAAKHCPPPPYAASDASPGLSLPSCSQWWALLCYEPMALFLRGYVDGTWRWESEQRSHVREASLRRHRIGALSQACWFLRVASATSRRLDLQEGHRY